MPTETIHNQLKALITISRDPNLTYKAKGIAALIYGHNIRTDRPASLSISALARASRDGRDAVQSGVAELRSHGYLDVEVLIRTGWPAGSRYTLVDPTAGVDTEAGAA